MEDENTDTIRETSKSPDPESFPMTPSCEIENIGAIICDLDAEMHKNLNERSRTWLECQKDTLQMKNMITENEFNTPVNKGVEELIKKYLMEMEENTQSYEEMFNELCQKNEEIINQSQQICFNHTMLNYYKSSLLTRIEAHKERKESMAQKMQETTRTLASLNEQNRQRFQSLEKALCEMSQRAEVIGELFSQIAEERNKYEAYLKETRKLDRTEAELETYRIMLKDSRQIIVDLEVEEAKLMKLQGDQEKSLEGKLASNKQLSMYLASNERVIEEWKVKNKTKIAKNEKMREKCKFDFERTNNLIDKEIRSKEEKIEVSRDSMNVQEVKDANKNLMEWEDMLTESQRKIEQELKATTENLDKLTIESELMDKKVKELEELEANLEIEQFLQDARMKRKRHSDNDGRSMASRDEDFRSPILGTPKKK